MVRSKILRTIRPAVLCFLLVTASVAAPGVAVATEPDAPVGYSELIEEAIAEFDNGQWAEARALFENANAMYPNARALRGIGFAAFELRDYAAAHRALTASLDSAVRPLSPSLRRSVADLLRRCEVFLVRYRLQLEPSETSVTVNGESAYVVDGNLILALGEHELVFHAPGHRDERRVVTVRASSGAIETLAVALDSASGAASMTIAAPGSTLSGVSVDRDGVRGARVAGFALAGLGGGLLVAGLATALRYHDAQDELERQCPDGYCAPGTDLNALQAQARQSGIATDVLVPVGAASAVAGTVLVLIEKRHHRAAHTSRPLAAGAGCLRSGCSLTVTRRF